MPSDTTRREFLNRTLSVAALGICMKPGLLSANEAKRDFKISLAEWSLHRAMRGGKLDNLDFAKTSREEFGIEGIEYVNQFFKDKAHDSAYLTELNKRANDHGVKQLLIMCDGEGNLGDPDPRSGPKLSTTTTSGSMRRWS